MKYFILLLSVFLVVLACNKPSDTGPDRENMLRNGKWKLVDMAHTFLKFKPGQLGYDTTEHDTLRYCNRDDYFIFGPGFNGTVSSNSIKCEVSDPDQVPFRWEALNNDTILVIYGLSSFGASLTDTSLHYIAAVPNTVHGTGPVFTDPYKVTFKQFSQGSMVLRTYQTYTDPLDVRKTDTSFWDYTFINY